jgi:DNA-binding transcriptional LysR family regulator
MDSLLLIQTFREVALRGSFSAAAKSMGHSRANASKYVAELERRFAVRLFHRSTRSVSLTDAGELLLERSEPLLDLVDNTRNDLAQRTTQPSGRLRVSAVASLADGPVLDTLTAFAKAHPLVHLSCEFTNRRVDLIEEAVDLVLRAGRIADSDLIVKRLAPVPFVVVASPAYWAKHGTPEHPDELSRHQALVYTQDNSAKSGHSHWAFLLNNKLVQVPVNGRLDSTSGSALVSFACEGLGVAYLPAAIAAAKLASGEITSALGPYLPQDTWLYAAYANRKHNSAALKALLGALEASSNTIKKEALK